MSIKFISLMGLTLAAADELKKTILVELLSDYAKSRTDNKLQYIMIKLLAEENKKNRREENELMYKIILRYIQHNSNQITKELLYLD